MPRVRKLSNGEVNGTQAAMKLPPARDEHLDIGTLEREAAAHDELFKALLEMLMTGRLRMPVVEEA